MNAHDADRYYRASRAAHRAWCETQPQYVIPGLLDRLDADPLTPRRSSPHVMAAGTGVSVEPVRLTGGTEPHAALLRADPQAAAASLLVPLPGTGSVGAAPQPLQEGS